MKKIWPPIFLLLGSLLLYSPPIFADIIYYYDQSDVEEAPEEAPVMDDQETTGPQEWTENEETNEYDENRHDRHFYPADTPRHSAFGVRLPALINGKEKTILVNPRRHVWGAYAGGRLIHSGLATSGSTWCPDLGRPCRTRAGTFRIVSLGNRDCISSRYPLGKGGAPMPYCMYFNGNQGIHGSYAVSEGNKSHGCVRITVNDAAWLRFHFASIGTKVIIMGY